MKVLTQNLKSGKTEVVDVPSPGFNSNKILSQENLSDKEIFIHSHKIDILKQIS